MKREETDKIKWTVALCGTLLLFLYGLFTQNIPGMQDYQKSVNTVHGILQAGILERVAISCSRGSS